MNKFCKDISSSTDPQKFTAQRDVPLETQAARLKSKQWSQHQVLRIKFLGGTDRQKKWVRTIVNKTFKDPKDPLVNLTFKWLPDNAKTKSEIRISFLTDQGSWSYLGTDCLEVPQTQPTMNLAWLDYSSPTQDGGVIKHEFGHCLGPWIHESAQPAFQCV
jgi:hypothetical protein